MFVYSHMIQHIQRGQRASYERQFSPSYDIGAGSKLIKLGTGAFTVCVSKEGYD